MWIARTSLFAVCALAVLSGGSGIAGGGSSRVPSETTLKSIRLEPTEPAWPSKRALHEAESIAQDRQGLISFAADGPGARPAGRAVERQFFSASVSKAMLLVAELRRLERAGAPLDEETHAVLTRMITASDNDAADAIYGRVGDTGLTDIAEAAGMQRFSGGVGHWANVKITAADMARFMSRLDELLDLPHGEEGRRCSPR